MKNRRDFLKTSIASSIGLSTLSMAALTANSAQAAIQPNDYKTLIYLYLDGGNDSFNMLIPNTSAEYQAYHLSRGNLAFDKNQLLPISPINAGNNSFGLHPAMTGIQNLFNEGDLAFIANTGALISPTTKADIINGTAILPKHIAGHNIQTAYWKADHDNSFSTSRNGWGGRIANEFVNLSPLPISLAIESGYDLYQAHEQQRFYDVSIGGLATLLDYDISRTEYNNPNHIARRHAIDAINQMGKSDSHLMLQYVASLFDDSLALNTEMQTQLQNIGPLYTTFATTNISQKFRSAAEMISLRGNLGMKRQIIYIQMNGFDTHGEQQIIHNQLMQELDEALVSFNQAMYELNLHSSVVTFTGSEFGRTLSSNGDGTDHAWGGNHIIMGGGIKGSNIYGHYPSLELSGVDDYTDAGRMIPTTSVSQYGATLAKWFGVPENRMNLVFPNLDNFTQWDLGFFNQ